MKNLTEWLNWLSQFQLSVDDVNYRDQAVEDFKHVKCIAESLGICQFNAPVITIAGTNGKGSCSSLLEASFLSAGYRAGVISSPHLLRFNERLRIAGEPVEDEKICQAFEKIKQASGEVQLTYYRFFHLSLIYLAYCEKLDVMLLEVGLGGRFDTINVVDADLAVITSIALDHCNVLGDTRDLIAKEKAGIIRPGKSIICGDENPPACLQEIAKKMSCEFYQQGVDFSFKENETQWCWQSKERAYTHLPKPTLLLQNASTVLMTLQLFDKIKKISESDIHQALKTFKLHGRCELLPGKPKVLLDVAHNVSSVKVLIEYLDRLRIKGQFRAIFAAMKDKDIAGMLSLIAPKIKAWYLPSLPVQRAERMDKLSCMLSRYSLSPELFDSVSQAYEKAVQDSKEDDLIVVFGTFAVVSEVLWICNRVLV